MRSVTRDFAEYLTDKAARITPDIMSRAEACRQDYLSVAEAGAAKNRDRWEALLARVPEGRASLIGYNRGADGRTAALINGFNAHSLELDDGHRFAMIHLGASVISAIRAAADENPISEESFLRGIVMGYEAACRTAIAMQPSHKNRGYHAAGTCGTVGCAVGTAFALGMDADQLTRVLTCAAGSAAGLLEIQEQGSELKPYNVGRAAMDGLTAALMGFSDYGVPDDMMGGERGFFAAHSDTYDAEKLTAAQDYFEIERIYVKPYASCRHSHSAVEAAIGLHDGLDVGDIDSVTVRTYRLGVRGHDHKDIQGVASAKLSTPYAVAAGLLYGRADLTVFEPLDGRVIELAARVNVAEDPELTAEGPEKRVAVVTVTLRDGTVRERRVDYAKGEPENPMTEKDMTEKRNLLKEYSSKGR